MKQQFISLTGQPRLLLIFAGWGMDATPFSGLQRDGYDIAVVWDYTSDQFDTSGYQKYRETVVLAWSMGVWGATRVIPSSGLPVTLTIAVNGTTTPVSDTTGIPTDIFNSTLNSLSPASLLKFYRRTAGGAAAYRNFASHLPQRDIDELRTELIRIAETEVPATYMRWDKAIISTNDAIFPPENQHRHWDNVCETITIEGPHLPAWNEILEHFIIDKSLVQSRFSRSSSTYDKEATMQQRIASHLWALWQTHMKEAITPDHIIEIGYGTGTFTQLYTKKLSPVTLQLWDLVPPRSTTELPGQKICCDAETAIMHQHDDSVDAIVSTSAIQWFNSISGFLRQSLRALRPGGVLVASTFGSQTFRELAQAGMPTLPYMSIDSMRAIIPDGFEILDIHEGIITKMFDSPMDVLKHMKATGVNALRRNAPHTLTRALITQYPMSNDNRASLTYNPIYLILKKS